MIKKDNINFVLVIFFFISILIIGALLPILATAFIDLCTAVLGDAFNIATITLVLGVLAIFIIGKLEGIID